MSCSHRSAQSEAELLDYRDGEECLLQAKEAESEIQRGTWRGPLHGIPIALTDLFDTAGIHTTAASAVYKDRVPTEDAEVVRRLNDTGAVMLGKTNMVEFAYATNAAVSYFGVVNSPWEPAASTGGSSGGSAAAVAAGLCWGALGSDTAGSIRIRGAICGVVGLKPSYGLVSTRGAIPLSWSLQHVGPITRRARGYPLDCKSPAAVLTRRWYCNWRWRTKRRPNGPPACPKEYRGAADATGRSGICITVW